MTDPLKRVLVSQPADGDFEAAGWRPPDTAQLRRDHATFVELLDSLGANPVELPPQDGLVDGCFTYDPVLVSGAGAIELQMAKPVRRPEPARLMGALRDLGVPALGALEDDALADAGDMFWLDAETLAVARGYRTNAAAHAQLARLLEPEGVRVERFDLPNHRGPEHLLHLLSVVSPLTDDLAVVFEPLMPVPLVEALDERGVRRVHCDPDEFELQGCNVLAVKPGVLVMADSAPRTRRAIEAAGCEVHTYPAGELNKGDGGPTCLTRPVLRTVA